MPCDCKPGFSQRCGDCGRRIGALVPQLTSSEVEVTVETQVSITTVTQVYYNNLGWSANAKYGFPMQEGASATELRWYVNGQWNTADFSHTPQDTTIPGGGSTHPDLTSHLGTNPLYFSLTDPIQVELLPYSFGSVDYFFPNDYSLIQSEPLEYQNLKLDLYSDRTILSVCLLSHEPSLLFNDGHEAHIEFEAYESNAIDYEAQYVLNSTELGLFGFSTYLPTDQTPDPYGSGYFAFIVEPDPTENVDAIDKVFTFIIDRSGSMSGNKIVQARNAASFIVEHLNEGDRFNLVSFSSMVDSFEPDHVSYTPETEEAALAYISSLGAGGSTNISGAFSEAVPQFDANDENTANIIIFFTDGNATAGITETEPLLDHINDLVVQSETDLNIFTFGVGSDVNTQLLARIAMEHNGLAEFLGDEELEETITNFYTRIRNPVLLDTEMSFSPDVIVETYPSPLPNLYKGQQLILSGRYSEPVPVTVTLSGNAFGYPVEYSYEIDLSSTQDESYGFLTKLWAKLKIEHLLMLYYTYGEDTPEAEEIRDEIVNISILYGVISPFTSFDDETPIDDPENEDITDDGTYAEISEVELLGNFPNPFNPHTTIRFQVNKNLHETLFIKIYNTVGQLVRILSVRLDGSGVYEVEWDAKTKYGDNAATGSYFYVISFRDGLVSGRMTLLK
ncbi:MAG: hypothetical protein B6244_12595 [Candidatus Cloacimonetes bacterium 4572_55]|nr:MAG: hypothetical protein B6244_12595 [Candidatus Cloacimonetes bacterium 4572_55]